MFINKHKFIPINWKVKAAINVMLSVVIAVRIFLFLAIPFGQLLLEGHFVF